MSYQRTSPGQRLNIRADEWNRVRAAASDYYAGLTTRHLPPAPGVRDERNLVWIRNTTAVDAPRWSAMALSDPVWSPQDQGDDFGNQIAFDGVAPSLTTGGAFAMLIEPIAAGQVGRGLVAGITAAHIELLDPEHRFAAIGTRTDESVGLVSDVVGPLELLWHDDAENADSDGNVFALVRWREAAASVARMVIKEEFNDYLRCRTVFESDEGQHEEGETDILVAKPWKLRHDEDQYPGVTGITTVSPSQVTAANGEDETWVVHWPYTVGDHITASQPKGGTGVWVDDQQLVWLDDNRDGRVWRLVEEED